MKEIQDAQPCHLNLIRLGPRSKAVGVFVQYNEKVINFNKSETNVKKIIILYLRTAGYGVFATKDFSKSEFLAVYDGTFLDPREADQRADQTFLYYFSNAGNDYW